LKTAELRLRLAEVEQTLHAIRTGEVDAVVTAGKKGTQVFTLGDAADAYRVLIESMNEGALTLTADKMILYANERFARMVKCPLQQVIGGSFRRFLSVEDRAALRPLIRLPGESGAKVRCLLNAGDGSCMPVQISIRRLARKGSDPATVGMVVTDLTEARRAEELLRALAHRGVRVQEAERERVALELHDNVTQRLCSVLFSSQALVDQLSARGGPVRKAAVKLREMIGRTAREVERISQNLRPSVLDQLGLVAVLRATAREFSDRTGVPVTLAGAPLSGRLAADTELGLFRIVQESLENVEKHALARHVTVSLTRRGFLVQLTITDDGTGFDPGHHPAHRKGRDGLGLPGMCERAIYMSGVLKIKSSRGAGTEIKVRIPLPPGPAL